ncbi:MAG: histidine kinase [Gemmatimonadales bacterium]|nr:histidine kinase [Gemmatimonadales bacterium]
MPRSGNRLPFLALESRRRAGFLLAGAWLIPAILSSAQLYTVWQLADRPGSIWRALLIQAPCWLVYALITPLVLWLERRFSLRHPPRGRAILVHLALAILSAAMWAAMQRLIVRSVLIAAAARPFSGGVFLNAFLSWLPMAFLAYGMILAVGVALAASEEARERERRAGELTRQLAEARLTALRAQIQPHFLFNTLNAVSALAEEGNSRAVARTVELLSGLLRATLRDDAPSEYRVEDELRLVEQYLAIQQIRHGDRLRITIDVTEAVRAATISSFAIQPLVENAIRHGIGRRMDASSIEITGRIVGGRIVLAVSDDGAGLPAEGGAAGGVGLANVRSRLITLYGPSAELRLDARPAGGAVASISFPLVPAPGVSEAYA